MPAIYQYGKIYSGGTGGREKTISYEEYTALTTAEKNNGTTYFIPDYPLADTIIDENQDALVFVTTEEAGTLVQQQELEAVVSVIGDIENEQLPANTIIEAVKEIDETVKYVDETVRKDLATHMEDNDAHGLDTLRETVEELREAITALQEQVAQLSE